jgi:ribosome recycling factor
MKTEELETLKEFSTFEQQIKQIQENTKNSPIDENTVSKFETIVTNMFTKLIGTLEDMTNKLEKEIKTLNN